MDKADDYDLRIEVPLNSRHQAFLHPKRMLTPRIARKPLRQGGPKSGAYLLYVIAALILAALVAFIYVGPRPHLGSRPVVTTSTGSNGAQP